MNPKKKRRIQKIEDLNPVAGWEDRPGIVPLQIGDASYPGMVMVYDVMFEGPVHRLYRCAYTSEGKRIRGVFKIARLQQDDDLTMNAVERLKDFTKAAEKFKEPEKIFMRFPHPPEVISCPNWEGKSRIATASPYDNHLYSLIEVRQAHPKLELADAAWMFNRLLENLFFVHKAGLVHASVLPPNVLINAEAHGGMLVDWCFARKAGDKPVATVPGYEGWYPPEVFEKQPLTPGVDVYMAARCLVYSIGGNPDKGVMPSGMPSVVTSFLRACSRANPADRPDAGDARVEFGNILKDLFGKPAFRPLVMPARV